MAPPSPRRSGSPSTTSAALLLALAAVAPSVAAASAAPPAEPRPVTAADADEASPPGPWLGVAVSPARPGVLAIWSERSVRRSRDGGRTFREVPLAGLARVGSLVLTRGDALVAVGVSPAGRPALVSSARSVVSPDLEPHEVHGAGRHLAVVGAPRGAVPDPRANGPGGADEDEREHRVALSADGGRTWRTVAMPRYGNFDNVFRLEPDGTARLLTATEAACGGGSQDHWRLDPGATAWRSDDWPFDAPVSMQIGPHGWQYALDDRCDGDAYRERPCAARGGRVVALGDVLGERAWESWSLASNGRVALATLEGRLLRLVEDHARTLSADVPPGLVLAAVDPRGRPLGLLRGRIVRWSPRSGWRVLAE